MPQATTSNRVHQRVEKGFNAMADMTFVLANKNYCLWPLPAWLCMKTAKLDFEEVLIPFEQPDTTERMLEYGPTGRVPVLKHGDRTIWDSLAICEYVNELVPEANLWPTDSEARSVARSVAGGNALRWRADNFIRPRHKRPASNKARHSDGRRCKKHQTHTRYLERLQNKIWQWEAVSFRSFHDRRRHACTCSRPVCDL